jgi:hypothetical protein
VPRKPLACRHSLDTPNARGLVDIKGGETVALTAKQEKFVLNVIAGMSQRSAYRDAYPNSRMKDETVDNKASKLLKNAKVRARYDELMAEAKKDAIWTREKAIEKLLFLVEAAETSIHENGVRQANSSAFLNAIKELNAVENVYEQAKLQTEYLKAKLELLKSDKKDTTLLEAILDVMKDE